MQTIQHAYSPSTKIHWLLDAATLQHLLAKLGSHWELTEDQKYLSKKFHFSNSYQMIAFFNAIAWMTHFKDHPPELELRHDHCVVRYTTETVNGLSEYDFLCAHKVEHLFQIQEGKVK